MESTVQGKRAHFKKHDVINYLDGIKLEVIESVIFKFEEYIFVRCIGLTGELGYKIMHVKESGKSVEEVKHSHLLLPLSKMFLERR